jgi:crossover junction endodeoxyribonuclease RuvC
MIILGIDPGYERIGIAIVEKNKPNKERLIFSTCFKTSAKISFEERLLLIGQKIESIIQEYKPQILAIETLFLNTNQKTVMHVSEARGVIIYEAMKNNLGLFEATPPQIKIATTGYGRADKKDVLKMVRLLIKIDENKKSDDELDAIAIAITAYAHLKY